MNQDLKSILSMTKILLSGKIPLSGLDSNEYRILKSCVALNQLSSVFDQFFNCSYGASEYKPDILPLMKSLSDNIYSYQSTNPEFNDLIQQFATRSPSINLSLPTSMKSSRASEKNLSSSSSNDKEIQALRRLVSEK